MNDPVVRFLVVNTAVSLALALGALASSWGRVRPSIVHLLWLAALVKLITPSVVPVPVWPAATTALAATAAIAVGPEIEMLAATPLASSAASSGVAVPPLLPSWDPVPSSRPAIPMRSWVLGLWAAGSAAWAGLALWRMSRFHRLLRHAQPMDGTLPPRVLVVDAAISPLLWAFLGRARIVVPKAFFSLLSEAELEAVLCHERAHFRRRDHWVRWVEFAVMTALWWHPLAWWISRRLRAAEEACCDAEVVADLPDRRPYASALLRTALFIAEAAPLPRVATGIGRTASIHHRVHTIMNAPIPRRLSFGASSALLAATALVVLASPVEKPGLLPEAQPAEEPPAPAPNSFASTAPEADLQTPPEASPPLTWKPGRHRYPVRNDQTHRFGSGHSINNGVADSGAGRIY